MHVGLGKREELNVTIRLGAGMSGKVMLLSMVSE